MLRIWKGQNGFSPKTFSLMLAALFAIGFMWLADTQLAYAQGTVQVSKDPAFSRILAGDVITFTITVSYTDVLFDETVMTDTLVSNNGLTIGTCTPSLSPNSTITTSIENTPSTIYITETMLSVMRPVTDTTSYKCPVDTTPAINSANTIDNEIDFTNILTYRLLGAATPSGNITGTATATVDIVNPSIQITKTTDTPIVIEGDIVTFTIAVTNTGDITLTNVIVSDPLVPDCIPTPTTPITLGPGQSSVYPCTVTVTNSITNVAQVDAVADISNPRPITREVASASIQAFNPSIQITKTSVSQIVNEGDWATFTITVRNTGDITLTNVIISDTLVVDCNRNLGELVSGQSEAYSCEVIVTDSFTNVAQVDAVADISIPRPITPSIAQAPITVIPSGQEPICVEGVVINHREQLVSGVPLFAQLFQGTPPISTESDDNGEFKFDVPRPGKWNFGLGQNFPDDWQPVTSGLFSVDLEAGQDTCYQIRFKIKHVRRVEVIKVNDAYTPLPDWIIKATPGTENNFAEIITATTDISGTAVFTLTEGLWTFTEEVPLGSDISYIPVIPRTGYQDLTIDATRPYTEPYKIYFKNRIISEGACIDIHKRDIPEGFGIQGWHIEVLRMDGTLAAMGYTDIEGNLTIEGLPSGPYTVVEEDRLGWTPVSSPRVDNTAIAGQACTAVTFENRQEPPGYCIEGRKIDINGRYGLPDWEIKIEPVAENGYQNDPESVMTDGLGRYRFDFPRDDYRIPGSAYEICEVQQDGWVTAFTTECQVVYLPHEPGACVQAPDFVNAQVGHDLTQYHTPIPTAIPTLTPTPVYPTATSIATPTNTPTQTTVIPPTATPTPSSTPIYPTVTSTATPTNTPTPTTVIPPTATRATPTLYPTATPTDRPPGQQSSGGDHPAGPAGKLPPGSKTHGAGGTSNGPAHTQVVSHDPQCQSYHTVRPGEGLSTIAAQYSLYHRDMLRHNAWVSAQKNGWVYPGQQLCVPHH